MSQIKEAFEMVRCLALGAYIFQTRLFLVFFYNAFVTLVFEPVRCPKTLKKKKILHFHLDPKPYCLWALLPHTPCRVNITYSLRAFCLASGPIFYFFFSIKIAPSLMTALPVSLLAFVSLSLHTLLPKATDS